MTREEINAIKALLKSFEALLSARMTGISERPSMRNTGTETRIPGTEERIARFEDRIMTRLKLLETTLLTAFHESTPPTGQRAHDLEYESLRTRVRKLEREWDAREENRASPMC